VKENENTAGRMLNEEVKAKEEFHLVLRAGQLDVGEDEIEVGVSSSRL